MSSPSARRLAASIAVALSMGSAVQAKVLRVPKDYPTIQQAIDAAQPGDVVEVSKGTYPEALLVAKSSITVRAKKGHKVFVRPANPGLFPLEVDVGAKGVRIERLRFGGTSTSAVVLDAAGGPDDVGDAVRLEGCTFEDATGGVISFASSFEIVKCKFRKLERGIVVTGNTSGFAGGFGSIRDCSFRDLQSHGVVVSNYQLASELPSIQLSVLDNRFEDIGGDAIRVGYDGDYIDEWVGGVLVAGNEIEGCGGHGIAFGPYKAVSLGILENLVRKAGGDGIRVEGDPNLDTDYYVAANRVIQAAVGVRVGESGQDGDSAAVVANVAKKCSFAGFSVEDAVAVALSGNTAKKSGAYGFSVTGGSNHSLIGNSASKSGSLDLYDTSSNTFFSGNEFSTIGP